MEALGPHSERVHLFEHDLALGDVEASCEDLLARPGWPTLLCFGIVDSHIVKVDVFVTTVLIFLFNFRSALVRQSDISLSAKQS